MAQVNLDSILAEYDRIIGQLTGENIRLRAAVAAYEAAENEAADAQKEAEVAKQEEPKSAAAK